VQTTLNLTFMEAVKGTKKSIRVRVKDACEPCDGKGHEAGTERQCATCGGQGMITQSQGPFSIQMPCNSCGGEGRSAQSCGTCRGSGFKSVISDLEASIPAGVDNDSNIRLRDKGDTGKNGGPRGHLYVSIRVQPDPRFTRDRQDIHSNVPISFITAAAGGKVAVPTLDKEVLLKVDPGTQPGDTRRMRGKGVKRISGNVYGDHYVHFSVNVPKHLSPEARALITQLAEVLPADDGGLAEGEELAVASPESESMLGKLKGWMGSSDGDVSESRKATN
jgi:molecular chaperone DnaJ